MQRYFASIIQNKVYLTDDDIHHVLHVMRGKVGQKIEVVNNGKLYIAEILKIEPLDIEVIKEIPIDSELPNDVTLFFALSKGDKIEFVLQKATELGAKRIVLFKCKRCVAKLDENDFKRKLERFNKIVKEASEQSHRTVVPEIIGIVDINDIPSSLLSDVNYVAYEKEAGDTSSSFENIDNYNSISVMVGPEGGFEQSEIDKVVKQGFKVASLGKRILRCETAAIYALSVIGFLLEK